VSVTEKTAGARPLTVAVVGRKGGAGKTTTSLNLAGVLAEQGQRVLLIDLDPQASLTRLVLGGTVPTGEGIGQRILEPQRGLDGLVRQGRGGQDLLPGDRGIEMAALTLSDDPTGPLVLRKLLRGLVGYDAVVIDTPPALGFALNSALLAASIAILPTMLVQQDLDALADTLTLRDRLSELGAAERIVIAPNAMRQDGNDRAAYAMLRTLYGDQVAEPIPVSVAIKYALNAGVAVAQSDPTAAAAAAYRALAARVLATESEVARA